MARSSVIYIITAKLKHSGMVIVPEVHTSATEALEDLQTMQECGVYDDVKLTRYNVGANGALRKAK